VRGHVRGRDRGRGRGRRRGRGRGRGLTDAGGQQARPAVVLLADAHGGADEPEARVALVHHGVPVAKVLADHLAVDDARRAAAVARCGETKTKNKDGTGREEEG